MITIKKVIIISWKGINQNVIHKNFVYSLLKKYKVYFLDITSVLDFESKLPIKKKIKLLKNLKIIKIKNESHLKYEINQIKPSLIIPYFIENYSLKTKKIFNQLKQLNVPLLKILDVAFTEVFDYYFLRVKQFFFKKIKYDYLIHVAQRSGQNFYSSRNNIYIHHHDFENYLEEIKKKKKRKKKYAVFLDENFVYHPDLIRNKRKNWIKPKNYFESLENFFIFFKKNFGLDVKIAAHPSVNKVHFKKFKSYYDSTAQLVKNAEIVFLHQSTSLSYPILFRKKIIFLTSNEINKTYLGKPIYNKSNFFNRLPLNLDNELNKKIIKKYVISNSIKYDEYINLFLKHPKSLKNNFANIFNEYFNKKKM